MIPNRVNTVVVGAGQAGLAMSALCLIIKSIMWFWNATVSPKNGVTPDGIVL